MHGSRLRACGKQLVDDPDHRVMATLDHVTHMVVQDVIAQFEQDPVQIVAIVSSDHMGHRVAPLPEREEFHVGHGDHRARIEPHLEGYATFPRRSGKDGFSSDRHVFRANRNSR